MSSAAWHVAEKSGFLMTDSPPVPTDEDDILAECSFCHHLRYHHRPGCTYTYVDYLFQCLTWTRCHCEVFDHND